MLVPYVVSTVFIILAILLGVAYPVIRSTRRPAGTFVGTVAASLATYSTALFVSVVAVA